MRVVLATIGIFLVLVILWDVFETIILPRRITRRFRLARMFYRSTWRPWSWIARRMRATNRRETFLSFYGPLSLLVLFCDVGCGIDFCVCDFAYGQWVRD